MHLLNAFIVMLYRYDEWDKYTKELEDLNISVGNFTVSPIFFFYYLT